MLQPNSQPGWIQSRLPALNPLNQLDLLTRFKTERSTGAVAESENDATAQVYMCCSNSTAVLVLDKAKPWSPSPEL